MSESYVLYLNHVNKTVTTMYNTKNQESSHIYIKKVTNKITGNSVIGIEFYYGDNTLKMGFRWENGVDLLPKKCTLYYDNFTLKCTDIKRMTDLVCEVADIFINMNFGNNSTVTRSGRLIKNTQKTNGQLLYELYHKELIVIDSIVSSLQSITAR